MFQRSYLQSLIKRVKENRKFIQVLMGPRQVGKTTLINQLLKEITIPFSFESADAISIADKYWISSLWEKSRLKMKQDNLNEYLIIIDEIQKTDNWSELIKKLWDEDSFNKINIKVILLGSSRLLLQQGLTESLAGRFETTYISHWSYNEMRDAFGFTAEQYVWFGAYPGSAGLINDENRWKKYISDSLIDTSISKDILMLTRVDKPALMKKLFELGCLYSGQILSYTKMQGQLQDAGNTTTLAHYLQLLNTAGLLAGVEKYASDIIRKRSSSPKFQVHNNALISAQHNEFFEEIRKNSAEWGRMVESAIGAHLVNFGLSYGFNVYYWRERNNEVDFIIEKHGKVIAIEVKSNSSLENTGLNFFNKHFNPHKTLLISNRAFPWKEFLTINPNELF